MPRLKTILNLMIFGIVVGGTIFGFRWYDGFNEAQKRDKGITFKEYLKDDFKEMKKSVEELPDLMKDVAVSGDKIKTSYIDKMANVVEMYAMDHGEYPDNLNELVGDYLDKKALSQKGFYYEKSFDGYEMGIELGNGEVYTIRK